MRDVLASSLSRLRERMSRDAMPPAWLRTSGGRPHLLMVRVFFFFSKEAIPSLSHRFAAGPSLSRKRERAF